MEMTILLHSKSQILLIAVLAGIAYYLLALPSIALSTPPENIAIFWPPNSVILTALLFTERRYWWLFILVVAPTNIIPNLQAGYSIERAIIFYFANCAEVLIAAFGIKFFLGNNVSFDRLRDMIFFLLWAVLIAPIVSAFIASFVSFHEVGFDYWLVWRVWFLAGALGHLALTPVIILFISSGFSWIKNISFIRLGEALFLVLCLIIVGSLSFGTSANFPALLYAPVPIFLWAALHFGPKGISTAILITTLLTICNTFNGRGPFIAGSPAENILSLQLFLVAISIPMMLLGSLFSERKQIEGRLRESENRLLEAHKMSQIGHWLWNVKTGVCEWSDEVYKIFGLNPKEFTPDINSIMELSPWPEDNKRYEEIIQKAIESREPGTFEQQFLRSDGSTGIYFSTFQGVYDSHDELVAMKGTIQDITERKKTEDTLRESHERFRASFTDASIGMALVSLDHKIIEANQSLCHMLGYTDDELIGTYFKNITHADDVETSIDYHQKLIAGEIENYHFEKRYIHKQGHDVWGLLSVSLVRNNDNSPLYTIAQIQDITERKQANELLTYQASHDALTGLVNRREFERRTERLLSTIREDSERQHALCFMDLDQFKVVNDTCGHTAGDEMLRQISSVLQRVIRHRDTLARLGGDEFGVLMEYCSLDDAHRVATSLQKAIQDYNFAWEGHTFKVGVSIGLVPITETIPSLTELLKEADAACYMAKDKGRNRIHVYHAEDSEIAERHGEMQWVERLYQALDKDRFCLYAQTIASLNDDEDIHYELLIRMIDEKGEMIPPNAFLPAAERYNLISRIDLWVIEKTFSLLQENPDFLDSITFCSINLSGPSLTDPNILDFIIELFDSSKIDGNKICFEITETAAIINLNNATKFISKLKNLGCRFALDDFGSGLSSFAYLKNLPVDYLKIDGMFVKDIVDDPIDHAMVKSINEIGHVMGTKTIAEFVENDVIKGMLKEIGVDYAQGYGIGKPEPLDNLFKS